MLSFFSILSIMAILSECIKSTRISPLHDKKFASSSLKTISGKGNINLVALSIFQSILWTFNIEATTAVEFYMPDTQILRQPLSLMTGVESIPTNSITSTISDDKFINKVIAFLPILQLRDEISTIQKDLESINTMLLVDPMSQTSVSSILDSWSNMANVLNKDKYNVKPLKLAFNSYADKIIVIADQVKKGEGTGMPSLLQTNQYLVRNSIITRLSDLRDDFSSFKPKSQSINEGTSSEIVRLLRDTHLAEDALSDCTAVLEDFAQYISLADPDDYKKAVLALHPIASK